MQKEQIGIERVEIEELHVIERAGSIVYGGIVAEFGGIGMSDPRRKWLARARRQSHRQRRAKQYYPMHFHSDGSEAARRARNRFWPLSRASPSSGSIYLLARSVQQFPNDILAAALMEGHSA
jgi:hypothetical protein